MHASFMILSLAEGSYFLLPLFRLMWSDKRVGKLVAKAMVDGCPIPPQWASDFLLAFFLEEEADQEDRMPIARLLRILHDVDADFDW